MSSRSARQLGDGSAIVRRPGGRTREHTNRIVAATMELLERGGYGALNFQDVARMAGVSRTTLYRRWESPAHLATEAIMATAAEQIVVPDTGALASDLAAILRQFAIYLSTPVGVASLAAALEVGATSDVAAHRGSLWGERFTAIAPIFERAQARGELPAGFDAEAALAMASGAMYYRVLVMAQPIDDRWIDRVVALAVAT